MDLGFESDVFFFEEVSCDLLLHGIIIELFSFLMDDSRPHSTNFKVQSARILCSEALLILAKLDLVVASASSGGSFLTTDRSATLQTLIIVEKSSILSVATLHLRVGAK